MKKLLERFVLWLVKYFNLSIFLLKTLVMDKYYLEYQFQSEDFQKEFLFPLFILANSKNEANLTSNKIIKELSSHFIISSVSPPKINFTKFQADYYKERYGNHINRNKVVQLDIATYKFVDFEPSPNLTFNENLDAYIAENSPLQKDIADSVFLQKYPVRVLKDINKGLNQFDEYYLINIGI